MSKKQAPDEPQIAVVIEEEAIHDCLLDEIMEAEIECQKAEAVMAEAKESLAEARKDYDGCVTRLRRLCRGQDEHLPLFDRSPQQSWRKTLIGELGFTSGDAQKLAEADVLTAGDLQDRMTDEGVWWSRGIKGIGDAAKERIEEAFNAFVCENDEGE